MLVKLQDKPRVAEFFAGIGLVRFALGERWNVVFANDIDPVKRTLYEHNFGGDEWIPGDIKDVNGKDIGKIELATASFPCTDLSLAGARAGLNGSESGTFWEFTRILEEMKNDRPVAVLVENVVGFGSSHGGADLAAAVAELNRLGYSCDIVVIDARHFVPQSRPRMFIIGTTAPLSTSGKWDVSPLRPRWVQNFVAAHPELLMNPLALELPQDRVGTLGEIVEHLPDDDIRWWDEERMDRFLTSLSPKQAARLENRITQRRNGWSTAYRRTRNGRATWEIRSDSIAGCLRTARGGSSKQALVRVGRGKVRARWMTSKEYARLQGANAYLANGITENQTLSAFGDAVCVPVIEWLAETYLLPLVTGKLQKSSSTGAANPVRVVEGVA